MMAENTYDRYRRALEEIADGADDPAALAAEALRSRKPIVTEPSEWQLIAAARKSAAEKKRKKRKKLAIETYNKWLAADCPPIASYARTLGFSRSKFVRLLEHAEKGLPWGDKRLGYWRNRRYDRAAEIPEGNV